MQDLIQLVAPLRRLCFEAGELICRHYHAPGATSVEAKADDSPLTRADLDSHIHLREGLARLAPQWPLLSEESPVADKALRRQWPCYWLVDPLDGTREFIEGSGEFTINVALIRDHRPVLGLLYVPLRKLAYVGIPGQLAARYHSADGVAWSSHPLATRAMPPTEGLTILASRRHQNATLDDCLAWLAERRGPLRRDNSGSALKFCQLAEGEGDFYPRFSPCCEWDVGAGQAVLEAAGGSVLGLDGHALRYNCRSTLMSPHFYAIADPGHPLWRELLACQAGIAPGGATG